MNKLVRSVTLLSCIGALLCFVGCGKSDTPESAFKKFYQSVTTGDIVGYWESTYSTGEVFTSHNPALMNETQKSVYKAILINQTNEMNLVGFRYLSTRMTDENNAKVLAISDTTKVTISFVCKKIDGKWKISSDTDDMEVVVDDVLSTKKESKGARSLVQKLIEASKRGKLTDEMIQSSFECPKEEIDGVLAFLNMFNLRNDPDYKKLSAEEKAEIEKEINGMGIRSIAMSEVGGYTVVSLGTKTHEMLQIKAVEKKGKWLIAGLYIPEIENLKRAQQAEKALESK